MRLTSENQGLYEPQTEHDSCGVGFVVHIKGKKSHSIIENAITILKNMMHRGACGCEKNTGDGVGILIQKPDKFFQRVCAEANIQLPAAEDYGAGMVFLPNDPKQATQCQAIFARIIKEEEQQLLGWREVPTDHSRLGGMAVASKPSFKQIFIQKNSHLDSAAFERKLYVIRKRVENEIYKTYSDRSLCYMPSLSQRTFIYKGMLTGQQLAFMFPEITDQAIESALALVHQRFSTNTFPAWSLAHPFRYVAHNGEINTLRGNINWMRARQALCQTDLFGDDLKKLFPIVAEDGSDSSTFDNVMEFLHMAGRPLPHAVMMMIPEAWYGHETMDKKRKAFYEYHASLMEPWDGPASLSFTDGEVIGAVLDRNGLRPSRYYVTKDDLVVMASEVGVLDIPAENVKAKARLEPGRIFMVDTKQGRIIADEEIKNQVTAAYPYETWLKQHLIAIDDLPEPAPPAALASAQRLQYQQAFGYTHEDLKILLTSMAKNAMEPTGSMGHDAALAVLSNRPRLIYDYFKQLFAQVTNPPLDGLREQLVTQISLTIGPQKNLLTTTPEHCQQLKLQSPIITNEQLLKIRDITVPSFKTTVLPIVYPVLEHGSGLEQRLKTICAKATESIAAGASYLILSDRGIDKEHAGIPALLATASVHHHLIRTGVRANVGLVLESAEPREVHHFATLLGYGIDAINPYLAFATLAALSNSHPLTNISYQQAVANFIKAVNKGLVKIMSKMGISTIQSYRGAQIFEALGLNKAFVDEYFTWTTSRISGIGLAEIAEETAKRHRQAFSIRQIKTPALDAGGEYQWRRDGEYHLFNPETVFKLQHATRSGQYKIFKEYTALVDKQSKHLATLRGLFQFKKTRKPIPLSEVEPIEHIMKRFSTGAMSYGSISKEAHEILAIAMNRIGGKSNTGEGGEHPDRFTPDANGDLRRSSIKQVASGRFGVTSHYLVNADDIQIKMAQGAKPGEGGQLPGPKVYPWIAEVRYSTPWVELISPPPHHDIYSIEDLAQLIHDLKNSNPTARVHVKLVAEVGVGTVAAGVAKALSDVILISGYDGGTGASPISSIKHAGLPWELGIAEAQQVLVMNGLRDRIVLQTDGQLKTGRDVIIAALLGAEEFGFATAPLVVSGCIMMRVCHLNTCPVGIATQDPRLVKKFTGKPEFVVNFFHYIAEEVREYMAALGFKTINEMVGQLEELKMDDAIAHWKAGGLDFSRLLHQPEVRPGDQIYCVNSQDHGLEQALDMKKLIPLSEAALTKQQQVNIRLAIKNTDRTTGTMLGYQVTKRYGSCGLPEDTINIHFDGSAGMSFGAFLPKGITMTLAGDANDYTGKGLSGGKLIVYPPPQSSFIAEDNILVGNVVLYGATSGEAYFRGIAGERFCVRNSGANAVVEGVGDHGCEYMTGGHVVILGKVGRNFAAGMSGGIAYVLDHNNDFDIHCNKGMVVLETLTDSDQQLVTELLTKHSNYTQSPLAEKILADFNNYLPKFIKVIPTQYKRVLAAIEAGKKQGLPEEQAIMEAAVNG